MKILSRPEQPTEFESTCSCQTKVSLVAADLEYWSDPREGSSVKWKCPTCHQSNFVDVKNVPASIVREVIRAWR